MYEYFSIIIKTFLMVVLILWFTNPEEAKVYDVIYHNGFEKITDAPATDMEAARFLTQATFGPTKTDIANLRAIGYGQWLEQQLSMSTTLAVPYMQYLTSIDIPASAQARVHRWLWTAVFGKDQLRQRMAYALSEILVLSDAGDVDLISTTDYWDMLAQNSFGNYRQLLEQVALHPMMGKYLTYVYNKKATATTQPDENFAREILQLFSIGLIQRNLDFSPKLDASGQPIPTYDQSGITGFSRIFTGWGYANTEWGAYGNYLLPMVCYENYHEPGSKQLLNGYVQPPNQGCQKDLEDALHLIFNHDNVAPFITRQLIQRFTTSNPSPAYIQRVASVFEDNGVPDHERGDLGAVIKAILMDPEARAAPTPTFGKAREPLLRLTALWRALPVIPLSNGDMGFTISEINDFGTRPLGAPTVFNFFVPDYQQAGNLAQANLYSPEFQIINEASIAIVGNHLNGATWEAYLGRVGPPLWHPLPALDISEVTSLAGNHTALIEELNQRFMYGRMSTGLRTILVNLLSTMDLGVSSGPPTPQQKALAALHLVLISPEFAIQN